MSEYKRGKLIIIGGAEDKRTDKAILKEVIKISGGKNSHIVLITTATNSPVEAGKEYENLFGELGAGSVESIEIADRKAANNIDGLNTIDTANCIFFVGGDQLRISSILGGTEVHRMVKKAYEEGKVIAGTSAGASMMSEIMVVEGKDEDAPRKCTLKMAPGMGFLAGVIIDQHFNQRGRIGRLLAAVAQNPYIIGIGIDEDTAMIVNEKLEFIVEGSGVVTVVDGREISFTNISEQYPDHPLAITNVKIHVFPKGYGFNLVKKQEILLEDTFFQKHKEEML
ncbi:MAG TPA: cyanophycinase [Bacillota bacterium]|nr:cyanophycinase [Bacillota bacterium]HPL53562.1 cyanophycinase [Bacillota bacterium]